MNIDPEILQIFYNAIHYVVFNLTMAVTVVIQRDSYLYWPFILSTIVIALLVLRFAARTSTGDSGRPRFRDYFGAGLWWHRSARADYRLYFANALLLPLILGPLLFSDAQIIGLIDVVTGRQTAPPEQVMVAPGLLPRLLFTLIFFVAYDFGRFVAHSLLHDIPALWEFHKVHHSAEVLTPITSFRVHPFDLLIMVWVPALTTGIATWVFNQFAAGPVSVYTFLGLHVAIWAFNLIDNLRHSPVWLTYGPAWGLWLISPAHHQLHHSCEPRHLGCNRGFDLAIWDRLYGTLHVPAEQPEKFRMGLGDATDGQWNSLTRIYLWPLAGFAREVSKLFRRRSMRRSP